jgi:ankyrin repeat protein
VAAQGTNPDAITALLNAGADAKAKDNSGLAALDYAKFNHHLKGTDALKQFEAGSK